uniref:Multidrug and toxin extrusion protein n=1 Tax=Sphaeramia orbicularis TaxID=375764 RepID=A0A672YCP3_9TELE
MDVNTKVTVQNKEEKSVEVASPAQDEAEGYGSCLKIRNLIPIVYRNELLQLFRLAGPVVISQLMIFMISIISTVFCGHLGKTELAAVSLATAVNVTGICIGTGLTFTCDTLISQTYGSGNLKRVGVILQRGILILLLACFPCWAVLINTEALLLAFRQSPEVASLSQLYVEIFMPALPAAFMFQLQSRYLQNQGIIWPQVVTGVTGNILNAIINYVLLFVLDLGIAGSATANAISQYTLAVVLYIYICLRGLHKSTWQGWSLDCLQEWGPFIRLAIPSMLMLCLEWWVFEIGGFLAGVISETELGAQAIIYQLTVIAYMIPMAIGTAATIRVGNALGAGNIEQAKLSFKVSSVSEYMCLTNFIYVFSRDVLERFSDVMVVFVFMHLGDAMAGVTGGVLRGAGKQAIGASINLVGHYFIGFPIGASLMFAADMGIVGLWTGLTICVLLQATFFITYLSKLNWKKAADEALVRAGIQVPQGKEMCSHDSSFSTEDHTYQEVQDQSKSATTTVGVVLSVTQLVLRRGLTLIVMILILVAGIIVNHFVTRLLK